MAKESFQIDPAAGGVSQAVFDAHTHNYDKRTSCDNATKCDPVVYTPTQSSVPQ